MFDTMRHGRTHGKVETTTRQEETMGKKKEEKSRQSGWLGSQWYQRSRTIGDGSTDMARYFVAFFWTAWQPSGFGCGCRRQRRSSYSLNYNMTVHLVVDTPNREARSELARGLVKEISSRWDPIPNQETTPSFQILQLAGWWLVGSLRSTHTDTSGHFRLCIK